MRELGKVFGLPTAEIEELIADYSNHGFTARTAEKTRLTSTDRPIAKPIAKRTRVSGHTRRPTAPTRLGELVYLYGEYLRDFPSHLSIHAGGILIAQKPIYSYTATFMPPKGFPTAQFSMIEAEEIGLYKFDILSQRGLGHIREAVDIIKKNRGEDIDIYDIAKFKADPRIAEQLERGHTMGCFYVESPAMRMLLCKLKANDYLSLSLLVP